MGEWIYNSLLCFSSFVYAVSVVISIVIWVDNWIKSKETKMFIKVLCLTSPLGIPFAFAAGLVSLQFFIYK